LREEGGVGRVGAGIAALDIVDAERVEQRGNGDLVLDGEVDAGRLLTVAQRGVEEVKSFFAHVVLPAKRSVARISRSMMPGSVKAWPAPSIKWKSASGQALCSSQA